MDGLNIVGATDYPAEQFDHIEVLDGLSGAIYGPANPAGTFNYVLKRPTPVQLATVRLGVGTGGSFLRSADVSNTIGAVGYRVNLLDEDGGSYARTSRLSRKLASLALDFHIDDRTVLETNYSYYRFVQRGYPPTFGLAAGIPFPKDIDPAGPSYGQTYAGQANETHTASARLKHEFNDDWRLSASVLQQYADRQTTQVQDTFTNTRGGYTSTIQTATASRFVVTSNLVHLNGTVRTGSISHAITVGTTGVQMGNYNPKAGNTVTLGSASLANPALFAQPTFPDFTNRYRSANAFQQALILSDTVTLTPQWSLQLTGSQSWLTANNYNVTDLRTSTSYASGFSPSLSVLYKILPNLTSYVTYASSLQQGDTAPVGSTNANSILAPFRSEQVEAGLKLALSQKIDLTLAAFQITRPFAFIDARTLAFGNGGQQRNRGVDVGINGEVLPGLAVFGGIEYLDPQLQSTNSPVTSNKQIVGLSNFVGSVLVRYSVPQAPGLVLDGFVKHASNRATDNANLFYAPGFTTLDLGVEYALPIRGRTIMARLDAYNVTNTRYLTNILPGGLNGYTGAGNASASLGRPRTIQASLQAYF
ncbi:MAG: TonB-dependent receptor [Janthinobacterium lividum]